jgi:hypothetical protein
MFDLRAEWMRSQRLQLTRWICFCGVILSAVTSGIGTTNEQDFFDCWDLYGDYPNNFWHRVLPKFNRIEEDPGWDFKDPTNLYLVFREKPDIGGTLTFLQPKRRRFAAHVKSYKAGHLRDAQAVGLQLIQELADGYEVSFQPIDPITGHPLPLRDKVVLFSRYRRTSLPLSDNLTVTGFYGSPELRSLPDGNL